MRVRFSVIMPAYNAASFINRPMDSLLAQTYRDFEVVVTDDKSTDGTRQAVMRYADRFGPGRVKCITGRGAGIAASRNDAIRTSSGEILAFLDHDDMWDPDKLRKVANAFDASPDAVLVCHQLRWMRASLPPRVLSCGPALPVGRMYRYMLFCKNTVLTSATSVRRAAVEKAGYFCEDIRFNAAEDYELWLRVSRLGRFHFIKEPLGELWQSEQSAVANRMRHVRSWTNVVICRYRDRLVSERRPWDFLLYRWSVFYLHLFSLLGVLRRRKPDVGARIMLRALVGAVFPDILETSKP